MNKKSIFILILLIIIVVIISTIIVVNNNKSNTGGISLSDKNIKFVPKINISGSTYKLPFKVSDLKFGRFYDGDLDAPVNANETYSYQLVKNDSNTANGIGIDCINPNNVESPVRDCLIYKINIYNDQESSTSFEINGIKYGDEESKIVKTFGNPKYVSSSGRYSYSFPINETEESSEEIELEFTCEAGKVKDVELSIPYKSIVQNN